MIRHLRQKVGWLLQEQPEAVVVEWGDQDSSRGGQTGDPLADLPGSNALPWFCSDSLVPGRTF